MPMDRRLYPENWDEIARQIKDEVNWACEWCGKPCRRPGETVEVLQSRLFNESDARWWEEFCAFDDTKQPKPGRFVLTVAHLQHNPSDCSRDNLRALCAPCHCRYDLSQMPRKQHLKRERDGQLSLLNPLPIVPEGVIEAKLQRSATSGCEYQRSPIFVPV